MTDIFKRNYRCYGYRRMRASLTDQSVNISEKVVRRLMKQECLVAATSKRRRYGSYLGEISPAPENVLNRNFSASAPNEKWLTDITEFQIPAGKVYLSPMIDCFDGMVVSWSIGTRPSADLRISAIVDGHFRLIVDGKSVLPWAAPGRRAGTGLAVAESSTISLNWACRGVGVEVGFEPDLISRIQAPARPPEAPPSAVSRMDLVALSSILWLACTTRSRMASANVGSLR